MITARAWLVAVMATLACGSSGGTGSDDAGARDAAIADAAVDVVDDSPPHGNVDPNGGGGTVNRLSFTAFGDIRPPLPDEDFAYPDATVDAIMSGMKAQSPEFGVATGDYMFVEYLPSSATGQLQHLLADEKTFGAPIFHAMGNHECQSFTDVNCPNLDESVNITTYLQLLLPWTTVPWFSFVVHTELGDAKFVFVAVNAWNDTQAAWLDKTMAAPTRYTFVIRHHPTPDAGSPSSAIGIAGSDAILNKYPATLYLFGHVHEYQQIGPNRVITGNAGAPLDAGEYGWLLVVQRPDGNIQATEYSLNQSTTLDFAVTPDGQATK
ncbi:MAG TPA: metallophosphoesterase [Polyangiaceae bacterium]|jgi:hypothetical protein